MISDTTASPFAVLSSVPAGAVRATSGALADVLRRTADATVPTMADLLYGLGHAVANFEIAAGEREGADDGPPFMDGDLYKWLEAVAALQSFDADASAPPARGPRRADLACAGEERYVHTPTLIASRAAGPTALADRFHFETYNLGHLITAGVVAYRVTGSTTLLTGKRAASFLETCSTTSRSSSPAARSARRTTWPSSSCTA